MLHSPPSDGRAQRGRPALRTRLRYRFDNALSRGPVVVIAYLALLTLLFVLAAGAVATGAGIAFTRGDGYGEASYQALLRMLDPGTFSGDTTWTLRLLALGVTLVGIVLGGSLIGLIANAVDQRVDRLQRGRGRVVERGHTLVLGWSAHVPQIISELVIANESERRASVVVLARGDKTEMEERVRRQVPQLRGLRVVVRNGDPALPDDLERVCATSARSIVAVRDEDGDAGVIKAVLAVRALDPTHSGCHVVAEMQDPHDAQTLRSVSHGRVVTVSNDAVVAEVTAQACSRPGLAAVFSDLLDFDGDEIYFRAVPELLGRTYAQARLALDAVSVVGRLTAQGAVELNPPGDTVLAEGDRLAVVAEDDSTVVYTGLVEHEPPVLGRRATDEVVPVRVLVVGWSAFGARVLAELDELLAPGSTVHVQVDSDLVDPAVVEQVVLRHATVTAASGRGGPEDLLALQALVVDQVIVLAYRDALPVADADARTLLSLLTLRLVWPVGSARHVRVVAELLDQGNTVIAAPAGADDLIVSDALASLMMAQLSERPQLAAVFEELFRPDGPVVVMLPADRLVRPSPVTFGEVVAAAGAAGASAFGYRLAASGQVVLNPRKSDRVTLHAGDTVIAVGLRPVAAPAHEERVGAA
ncbi:MAG: TrkA-N domain/Protein of unknown function [Frankiales bacterium]|nr:TrkA-N domain/Protein of unknown function [Frankiales bacterium]